MSIAASFCMNMSHASLCHALASGLLVLAASGCESSKTCDASLKLMTLEVKAPDDLVIARVTAENEVLQNCESNAGDAAPWTGSGTFWCGEQEGGDYDFVVEAEDGRRWTQTVEVDHDGCHIEGYDRVSFDLTTTEPD